MAEHHTIVVRVRRGAVPEVQFCDCCPPVTVEVRTYTEDPVAAAAARPVWYLPGGTVTRSALMRDERGIFRCSYFESETEDE